MGNLRRSTRVYSVFGHSIAGQFCGSLHYLHLVRDLRLSGLGRFVENLFVPINAREHLAVSRQPVPQIVLAGPAATAEITDLIEAGNERPAQPAVFANWYEWYY